MGFHNFLLFAFLVASLAARNAQAHYDRINRYLVSHVNTDEVGPNMEAASNWLKGSGSKRIPLLSTIPISGLKQFTALQQVVDDPKCDRADLEILRANEVAVGLYDLVYDRMVRRRVDKVMQEIFEKHAEHCHQIYLDAYHRKEQRLDGVAAWRAANIANTVLKMDRLLKSRDRLHSAEQLFEEYIVQAFRIEDCIGRDYLRSAIKANAKGDPNLRYLDGITDDLGDEDKVSLAKIGELVNRFLIEPCRALVDELGPDLFVPARFDAKFYTKVDESNRDYYLAWVGFMICKALTENEAAVLADVTRPVSSD